MANLIPIMTPAPGDRSQRFVGDRIRFALHDRNGRKPPPGWQARLRTNIGRAEILRREIIQAHAKGVPFAGAAWRDLAMTPDGDGWSLELPLAEVGFFKAKPYLLDPKGWQHWPEGSDIGFSVHPDAYRTSNTIYCAFPRLFGPARTAISMRNEKLEREIRQIEEHGFSIIPPSGKFRDLIQLLPHIIDVLGCRILQLLPVNPAPTTYARFGQFGSPYAALDLTVVDPALVVFDKRTTGIDQFRELTYATHLRGGRVFLDIVINHTGWGSVLQEIHPEWFVRQADGTFASPGAWGVTWEDLVELKHDHVALWDQLADVFLTWCRRGVDGFRCDAGYKVALTAWQYIIARVQQEFPETMFLLEGLGGSWETTEALLTEGGMHWAYSELFQNYSGKDIATYLDYVLLQSRRVGIYVHYSETHDNPRLAAQRAEAKPSDGSKPDRAWSLLRNRLCGLASVSGGFGFTCGAEWLATEKIRVHGSTGLAWGRPENLLAELAQLNRLLHEHPCFLDGAILTRLSPPESSVFALLRESSEGNDAVLVLVNTDAEQTRSLTLDSRSVESRIPRCAFDLLGQTPPAMRNDQSSLSFTLPAAAAYCLSSTAQARGFGGAAYRRARAQTAWGLGILSRSLPIEQIGRFLWRELAAFVDRSPFRFLAAACALDPRAVRENLPAALEESMAENAYPRVILWTQADCRRITPVPPDHWLLVEDTVRFRASLQGAGAQPQNLESIEAGGRHVACFPPASTRCDARLALERYALAEPLCQTSSHVRQSLGQIRFLGSMPEPLDSVLQHPAPDALILLTNAIGGMARINVDLGKVQSKYDCVLAANLHPTLPVDRHVFVKRIRVWVNADGFLSPLDAQNLGPFEPGPPALWRFSANAGDARTVSIEMTATMVPGQNATVFQFRRPSVPGTTGRQLPPGADVRLTVRVDIEDRSFHCETKRNGGADVHFATHVRKLQKQTGFSFTPSGDRELFVTSSHGAYHVEPEWCENIPHPLEQTRGQTGSGDSYSPGWFEIPMPKGGEATLIAAAGPEPAATLPSSTPRDIRDSHTSFEAQLIQAADAFVVRRGTGKTVIAGYPWFLDWGRDTFICTRGLLAVGQVETVRDILLTFARFEEHGTLPNTIHGENASNRDTSDAPLWFGLVCEELARSMKPLEGTPEFYSRPVSEGGRSIQDVLVSIAANYAKGTPNGIRMDTDSALIWSPSHFTWMDTNYPAATPREGFPIEIQALWVRLLRQLASLDQNPEQSRWGQLADRALESLEKLFWLEERGWYADVLIASAGQPAARAVPSDALRSNCLLPVSLGLVSGERARRCVDAVQHHLVIPGALRSLAPLPVSVPLPVYGNGGQLLNRPNEPYWGSYEGDEDTRRKPAYHNGTAWTWTFPIFCEALARAWDFAPPVVAAARAYLGSMDYLLKEGCLGHIPEILDGDAPHTPRGCDAQAWGTTEALRIWKLLEEHRAVEGNANGDKR